MEINYFYFSPQNSCHKTMVCDKNENIYSRLLNGQPIIFAEGQFVACQSNKSNTALYSPQQPIKMSRLCHILSLGMAMSGSVTLNYNAKVRPYRTIIHTKKSDISCNTLGAL